MQECTAAWQADAVIVHAASEADLLRQHVPRASFYQVRWDVAAAPALPFANRTGVAFLCSGDGAADIDAAHFLAATVMKLVWQADPAIACQLIGSALSASIKQLAGPGITVTEAGTIPTNTRLTVAPQRVGAGLSPAVLSSFAAGIPCVMSPVAAEGLTLPALLQALVHQDAAGLAAQIVRLHTSEAENAAAAAAGLAMVQRDFNPEMTARAMQAAAEGTRPV